jgi:hypothetical protein
VRLVFREVGDLHGQVVDETGQPLPDVEVRAVPSRWGRDGDNDAGLVPHGSRLMAQWLGQSGSPCRTGPDGRFTLSGLQMSGWLVTALKEGYVLDTRAMSSSFRWLGPLVGVYAIPHPEEGSLRLVLRRGGQVTGRLVGPDGSPLRDFQLNGYDVESPEGRFLWSLESGAETVLTFNAPELAGAVRRVHGREGEAVDLGDVVLEEGRTLRVRAVDAESGQPLLSAWVEEVAPDTRGEFGSSLRYRPPYDGDYDPVMAEVEAQEELERRRAAGGAMTLEHVAEEPLVLVVHAEGYRTARVTVGTTEQEVTVPMHTGARLEGRVLAGGQPLKSGRVSLFSPQGERVATGYIRDGKYDASGLEAGRYLVGVFPTVHPPRPVFQSQQVEVPEWGVVRLDFESRQGGATVEVVTGEPVDRIYLVPGHWPMPDTSERLDELRHLGWFAEEEVRGRPGFRHVPGGVYTLFVLRESHSRLTPVHREELRLPGEGEVTVTPRLEWRVLP